MREEVPSLYYGFEDCALRALYLLGNRKNVVELVRRDYHYPVFVADHEVSPHSHGASDGRRLKQVLEVVYYQEHPPLARVGLEGFEAKDFSSEIVVIKGEKEANPKCSLEEP